MVKLSKRIFTEEMERLIIFYPSWGIKADEPKVMKTWFYMLVTQNFTDESFIGAVRKHIKEVKFNPTIASLIDCETKNTERTDTTGFIDLDAERTYYE